MTNDFVRTYDYMRLVNQPCTNANPFPRFSALTGLSTSNPVYAHDLKAAMARLKEYFRQKGNVASLNCLLLGPPGAGKTYLAKQLTAPFKQHCPACGHDTSSGADGVVFEEHNLSLTSNPDHLKDKVFNDVDQKRLVFIDEFDVTVAGSSVVRFILDPLTRIRKKPTVYVFSGSYLRNIHVLRSLSSRASDFDFPRFLLDLYLEENSAEARKEISDLYQTASWYSGSRQTMAPDNDVVGYLRSLDKLQDFLSRINGFVIQVPDISSPMTTTRPPLSINHDARDHKTIDIVKGRVSPEDIINFVRVLEEPKHLCFRRFSHPDEPVCDYKNMLLTERYGFVSRMLSEHIGKSHESSHAIGISKALLNYLVMVPLLHNIRSLKFLIDNCLKERAVEHGSGFICELVLDAPQKNLFSMHVASSGIFEDPQALWQFVKLTVGDAATGTGEELVQVMPGPEHLGKQMALVTVIIPNRGYQKYLPDALRSIAGQDYSPIELIVVNDGEMNDRSDRDSFENVISGFLEELRREGKSGRFWRALCIPEIDRSSGKADRAGKLAALNDAIRCAHGEYAVILDADDLLETNYISSTLKNLEAAREIDESIAFVYTDCTLFGDGIRDPDGSRRECIGMAEAFSPKDFFGDEKKRGVNYIPEPALTLMVALHQAVPFDEDILVTKDSSTKRHKYSRLLENGWKGVWLSEPLFKYRMHDKNGSGIADFVGLAAGRCKRIQLARLRQVIESVRMGKLPLDKSILDGVCVFDRDEDAEAAVEAIKTGKGVF